MPKIWRGFLLPGTVLGQRPGTAYQGDSGPMCADCGGSTRQRMAAEATAGFRFAEPRPVGCCPCEGSRIMATPRTFILAGKELDDAAAWIEAHRCDPTPTRDAERASITYAFTPGGLGTTITVHCSRCGQGVNVTDFARW